MSNDHQIEPEVTESETTESTALAPHEANGLPVVPGITADTLKKYLYSFESKGEEVVDVTLDGINHLAAAAGVSIEDVDILTEDDDSVTVKAVAINKDGIKNIGIVRESKRTKQGYTNTYALQNAVSKAQRNARKGLLPMTWLRDLISEATGGTPSVDELEGRLENAKSHYRSQKDEIEALRKENKALKKSEV